MDLRDKRVLVFGSGISGIGAADLLAHTGADIVIYDGNEKLAKADILAKLKDTSHAEVLLGEELDEKEIGRLDLAVLSPGVPTDLPLVNAIRDRGVRIWGEVELAYRMSKSRRVLAITGTNGKTTSTALLGEIMKDWEESVFVVGNIGIPYTSVALEMEENSVTVAEISSFQLETIEEFHPVGSAITNITEAHLNHNQTMEECIRGK